ncbi:MAG: serine/threonine-protein kinase [Coxiellaceae bacterium]|nr:serine/threonine-protein kinase [Coxiellaceae bacterium]
MRRPIHRLATSGPLFTIRKVERRSQNRSLNHSTYAVTNTKTGEVNHYRAQHATSATIYERTFLAKPCTMSDRKWRRSRYNGGSYSTVKKLTKLTLGEEAKGGSGTTMPDTIALKCYTKTDYTQVIGSEQVTRVYNAEGEFAASFTHNKKFFFASKWIDGLNLAEVFNYFGTQMLDDKEFLRLFIRLTMKIDKLHRLLGRPIGDIKPENMMVTMTNGKITDITPIDLDNNNETVSTSVYMSADDYAKKVAKKYKRSISSDFYGIAVTMAICCERLTVTPRLDCKITRMPSTGLERYECGIKSIPLSDKWAAADIVVTAKAIQEAFASLKAGENPFTHPTISISHLQLDHDIDLALTHLKREIGAPAASGGATIFPGQQGKRLRVQRYYTTLNQLQDWMKSKLIRCKKSTRRAHAVLQIAQETFFTILPDVAAIFPELLHQTFVEQTLYAEASHPGDVTTAIELDDLSEQLDRKLRALMPSTCCVMPRCTIS